MITCYRVTQKKFAATAFDGEGARLYGGRWNNQGTSLVYTAGSLSLATLELLVHLESYQILGEKYCYLPVGCAEGLATALDELTLPANWRDDPAITQTKRLGDAWAGAQPSAVLKVPSAIVAGESNYLLNPRHPGFSQLIIHPPQDFVFDPRLVKLAGP